MLYMYFKKEYPYTILDDQISPSFLGDYCRTKDIPFVNNNSGLWFAYSLYYADKNGLSYMTSISFGKVITTLMTGVGVELKTEKYFKETTIIKYSEKILKGLILEEHSEDILIKKLFTKVFQLYKEDIEDYTYKTEMLTVKMSINMYEKFRLVEGKTKTEKLNNLLKLVD